MELKDFTIECHHIDNDVKRTLMVPVRVIEHDHTRNLVTFGFDVAEELIEELQKRASKAELTFRDDAE